MALGNKIIVSDRPQGIKREGILSDTNSSAPKPGVVMEITRTVSPVNGAFEWDVFGADAASGDNGVAADGDRRMLAILLPDYLQGQAVDTAYVASTATVATRIFLYFPIMGEELNMIFENISGTGADQDIAIGDILSVDNGTGKLLVSTGQSEPFMALEAQTDVEADVLTRVMYTGY